MAFEDHNWVRPIDGMGALIRAPAAIRRIQIYGQRCSGTNALQKLVEANFAADTLTTAYGFKHWFVPDQILFRDDVLVLVIARNAFDWLRSLHCQPWHAHPSLKDLPFSEFIRSPWHAYWDDQFDGIGADHPMRGREMLQERDPATGERFRDVCAKRTSKLAHWSDLGDRAPNIALLSQQALDANPEGVIRIISEMTALVASPNFEPVWSYKGNGFRAYEPTTYEELSAEDASFIESRLAPRVEARFGLATRQASNDDAVPIDTAPQASMTGR